MRRWRERAASGAPGQEEVARMYRIAERTLGHAGFRHYEIANWARPGQESRHNLVYWRNGEWLGVGAGAHTHLAGVRSSRPASLAAYLEGIDTRAARAVDREADDAIDLPILSLRTDDGLDLTAYAARFGEAHATRVGVALADAASLGLVRVRGDIARLTPRGRLLASEVFVRLIPDAADVSPRIPTTDMVAAS